MDEQRDPVSVIVPTLRWVPACRQLADQLGPEDELLVVCDDEADPVADREVPDGVKVLVAGEPEGCSGKANAMACGMADAANDRFVWTDADFDHPEGWLDELVTAGIEHGPATAIPFFHGGGWYLMLEPWTMTSSTLAFYHGVGAWGDNAWGGGVTFTREDLDVDQLVEELRQVVSDDALLSEHLGEVHPVRSMVTPVEVPGQLAQVRHRAVRFNRLTHVHEGMGDAVVVGAILVTLAIAWPVWTAIGATALIGWLYAHMGLRRWTFLLAFPGLFLIPFNALSGILVDEFEWAGRRYRLNDTHDVEVLASS